MSRPQPPRVKARKRHKPAEVPVMIARHIRCKGRYQRGSNSRRNSLVGYVASGDVRDNAPYADCPHLSRNLRITSTHS